MYTIDVVPMWRDDDDTPNNLTRAFEVDVHEDGKLLFKLTTMRGRAIAERLGVKAHKAWILYLSRRNRHKCANRKACRDRKAAILTPEQELAETVKRQKGEE